MSDSQFTRCPGCATVYRVTPAQLALRDGQVRCGHCRAVFDATAHRIDLAPAATKPSAEAELGHDDELAQGRATVTVRDASALEVADRPDDAPAPAPATPDDTAELEAARAALRPRRRRTRSGTAFYAVAIVVLVASLAAQSAALIHDEIVARVPQAATALDVLCRVVVCRAGPRRDAGALSIEGSDLRADPAHRGLLVLTATLRNRGGHPAAWPDIEISLTDSTDQTVVRRVLTPGEYLASVTDHVGIEGHSERQITLYLDASATRQAGYRLYLFYP